jgi:flagellar protein FlaG
MDSLKAILTSPVQSFGSVQATAKKTEQSAVAVSPATTTPILLPAQQDPNSPEHKQEITTAVKDINQFFQAAQRTLDFSLDDASGRMVMQIRDTTTNEVIRQIPSEDALLLAKKLDGLTGLLFKAQA